MVQKNIRTPGCISNGPQARLYGFRCLWQRCRRRRNIKLIAQRAIQQPLNPPTGSGQNLLNPLNPLNPAAQRPPQPSVRRAVKPKNPPAVRPVNLENLFPNPLNLLNPGRFAAPGRYHNPRPEGPSAPFYTTLRPQSGLHPSLQNPETRNQKQGTFLIYSVR